ncbi:MAG: oxalate:formate antiporter [Oscillospiraceae bacterium]|jgi:hypothetical protein|nr:oxalate:formate antiporter [Oscillospiraceae bacterium]
MITGGQQSFINHALPILKRDERVVGVALGGSYIRRDRMDEFSGLTFIVAVDPAQYEAVLAERTAIAARLGKLLAGFTGEHIQRPELLICLYDEPLLHVDLYFLPPDGAAERYENPVVIFERQGAITEALSSKPAERPEPDLQWYEDRFWIWVHYAATRIGRGELFDAISSLDFLRVNVLGPMLQIQHGKPPQGVRYIERDAPEESLRLAETLASYGKPDCVRALKAAVNLYISLRGMRVEGIALRDKAESRALAYLKYIAERIEEN